MSDLAGQIEALAEDFARYQRNGIEMDSAAVTAIVTALTGMAAEARELEGAAPASDLVLPANAVRLVRAQVTYIPGGGGDAA